MNLYRNTRLKKKKKKYIVGHSNKVGLLLRYDKGPVIEIIYEKKSSPAL